MVGNAAGRQHQSLFSQACQQVACALLPRMAPERQHAAMQVEACNGIQHALAGDMDRNFTIKQIKHVGQSGQAVFQNQQAMGNEAIVARLAAGQLAQHDRSFGNEAVMPPCQITLANGDERRDCRVGRVGDPDDVSICHGKELRRFQRYCRNHSSCRHVKDMQHRLAFAIRPGQQHPIGVKRSRLQAEACRQFGIQGERCPFGYADCGACGGIFGFAAACLVDNSPQDRHKADNDGAGRYDLQSDHLAAYLLHDWIKGFFVLVFKIGIGHERPFHEMCGLMSASFTQDNDNYKVLIADEAAEGRLDAWLTQATEGEFSRNRIKAWIEDGCVTVNGDIVQQPKHKIKPGDEVRLQMPEAEPAEPLGEDIELTILYEDDDLIVLIKPAGLVVHPGAGNWTGTLVNALIQHCGDSLSGIGGVKRPGIVHRLDKDTSGVMVVAKNDLSHRHLAAQFADHGKTGPLERAYHAIVWGCPRPLTGVVDAALGRAGDRTKRTVKREGSADARHAITRYKVLDRYFESDDGTALASSVECRLETGRTHQIRVHMAHIGHPLLGDQEYGAAFKTKANRLPEEAKLLVNGLGRQALHAFLLTFEHPTTGEVMHFEAPLPADMAGIVDALKA